MTIKNLPNPKAIVQKIEEFKEHATQERLSGSEDTGV
jgi:hypothetical protein